MTKPKLFKTLLVYLFLFAIPNWGFSSTRAPVEFEEDFGLPMVYLNIVSPVGSAQDTKDKLGLANIASQMLIRGTHKRSKSEFFDLLDLLGGQVSVDVRNEGTVIHAAVLSENLDKFLSLLEETLVQPKFTQKELGKLKKEAEGALLNEKANDRALVSKHFSQFFYGDHPYGNPPNGTLKGVAAIQMKDVENFHARYLAGRALVLFGSGAAKEDQIRSWFSKLAEKLDADHPHAAAPPPIAKPEIPKGRRALIVDKAKTTQTQVLLGGPGMRPELPGFYAILLANHSYGGHSFRARLMQEIRVKRGWTYGAGNSFRFGRQSRHFAMHFFPKTEDTVPAIQLTLGLFDDFIEKGLNSEEFKFAQNSLVNNAPFNFDTSKKRLENATLEYLMDFPKGYFRQFGKNIASVDYEDVAPALKRFFNPEHLTLTIVGDASKLKESVAKLPGFGRPQIKNYLED